MDQKGIEESEEVKNNIFDNTWLNPLARILEREVFSGPFFALRGELRQANTTLTSVVSHFGFFNWKTFFQVSN